jgi:hypothetical protein
VLGPIVDRIATRLSVFKQLLEIPVTLPIMVADYGGKYVYNHDTATSLKEYGSKAKHPKAIPTTQQMAKGKGKGKEVETAETKGETSAACKKMDLYQLVVTPLLVMSPGERLEVLDALRQFAGTLKGEHDPKTVEQRFSEVFTRNGKLVESVRESIVVEQILQGKRTETQIKGKKREDQHAENMRRTPPCDSCVDSDSIDSVQNCVTTVCCWPFVNFVCGHYFLIV